MEIKLKRVKIINDRHAKALHFTARLYINNIFVGIAKNDGHGHVTYIMPHGKEEEKLIDDAKAWYRQHERTLSTQIDTLAYDVNFKNNNAVFLQIMAKRQYDHVLVGIPGETEYTYIKLPHPIEQYAKKGKQVFTEYLKRVLQNHPLQKILNKNIPDDILNEVNKPVVI